jgi:hypothetical protein
VPNQARRAPSSEYTTSTFAGGAGGNILSIATERPACGEGVANEIVLSPLSLQVFEIGCGVMAIIEVGEDSSNVSVGFTAISGVWLNASDGLVGDRVSGACWLIVDMDSGTALLSSGAAGWQAVAIMTTKGANINHDLNLLIRRFN